jgi:hypothetical protein
MDPRNIVTAIAVAPTATLLPNAAIDNDNFEISFFIITLLYSLYGQVTLLHGSIAKINQPLNFKILHHTLMRTDEVQPTFTGKRLR